MGDTKKALLMAQKAVHCYPNLAECWAVFIASLIQSKKHNNDRAKDIVNWVKSFNKSEKLKTWMDNIMSEV